MLPVHPTKEDVHDPANPPDVHTARLPISYENVGEALAKAASIDECQDWVDKMEAAASYARQANNDEMRRMCARIQARASRRCGEILAAIPPDPGRRPSKARGSAPPTSLSRTQAAKDAGLSREQRVTHLRVAAIPQQQFEALVESENPPTLSVLGKIGTVSRPAPAERLRVRGLLPNEYRDFCNAIAYIDNFAKMAARIDLEMVARTCDDDQRAIVLNGITLIGPWIDKLSELVRR